MSDKPKHRWYQFSLKTLLVGMTVLCIGPGGYVAYEQAKARREKAAVEAIEKLGGKVVLNEKVPLRSASARQILGDDRYRAVHRLEVDSSFRASSEEMTQLSSFTHIEGLWLVKTQVTDAGLVRVSRLKTIKNLWLDNTHVTDAGIQVISGLPELEFISVDNTHVGDAGLRHLSGLRKLTGLSLCNTLVTDAGLMHFSGLTELTGLDLSHTRVTDSGIKHLYNLKKLQDLLLDRTQVTDAGVAELQKALPNCKIVR